MEFPLSPKEKLRICLVGTVGESRDILSAAQTFCVPIVTSETGYAFVAENDWITYFIMHEFDGPLFEAIHRSKHKILGPPALQQAVEMQEGLPESNRPIYNYSMKGVITCFTGIRKKDELTRLVHLIHSMGGSIRKDMNSKVTHLICSQSGGDKYQYAKTFCLAVIRPSWVYQAWDNRDTINFIASENNYLSVHKVKVFEGQKICFFGFTPDEHQHMVDVLKANGGVSADIEDQDCSHVVVDEHVVQAKPNLRGSRTHILKADWFWYTIQNGFADELEYLFGDYLDSIANTPDGRDSSQMVFNKRKRKRFSNRLHLDNSSLGAGKRRSSVSDAGLLSMSGSYLDCTTSPERPENISVAAFSDSSPHKKSMRYNHFMDLFKTESNYVDILDTIKTLFKEPLEDMERRPDAILNQSEIKAIFYNFDAILQVHKTMLEQLRDLQVHWTDDCQIGQIFLENQGDLMKAYPPYVNFFEQMKETLAHCDTQKPRFHAFLKINQAKAECGRQSLQDLMIRPVQRLPSMSLLINDILKYTAKTSSDYHKLEEALKTIKEVMTHINEDKRRTECQLAIFDIFNDIENCPPHLVSSHRVFVSRCEVIELSDCLSGRGDSLTLFLFSDSLEVCKKRSRGYNSTKSPSSTINSGNSIRIAPKPLKHIRLMPLNFIKYVVDIKDGCRAFSLSCKSNQDNKEKLFTFHISDEEMEKGSYLKGFCKQLAENACRADPEKFLANALSHEIGIDVNDVSHGTLSKAFKFATRTRFKVGRAFSFNKTPSKLKRAVSTMMTSPFGSTNSLTPACQLAQMKLASCTNINALEK